MAFWFCLYHNQKRYKLYNNKNKKMCKKKIKEKDDALPTFFYKKNERNKKYAYLNTTKENTAVNTIIMIKKKTLKRKKENKNLVYKRNFLYISFISIRINSRIAIVYFIFLFLIWRLIGLLRE